MDRQLTCNNKKVNRVLSIYLKLSSGEIINKKELATEFNVSERTIQRDIEDIRCYFFENRQSIGEKEISYIRAFKGYITEEDDNKLNEKSILAISKVLLESRAFCKDEINSLINSLINNISKSKKKYIKDIIGNELLNYVPVKHNRKIIDNIWKISDSIRHKKILNIKYKRDGVLPYLREVKPVSIIFSEYYFYLIAYIEDFKTPTIFRIDKIIEFYESDKRFYLKNDKIFQDGEFRKRSQFMYAGKLVRVKFRYYGKSVNEIIDRLPTAVILDENEEFVEFKAEVYGNGIMIWFLSQGSKIKVLEPIELVEDIKNELKRIGDLYAG